MLTGTNHTHTEFIHVTRDVSVQMIRFVIFLEGEILKVQFSSGLILKYKVLFHFSAFPLPCFQT